LRKHNIEQECPTKGLDTIKGRKWLAAVALGPEDRLEMDLLLAQWKVWDEQIKTLDGEIRKRQAEQQTAPVIATIPGCGAYSSLALASRIGSIERFPRPGSLANYCPMGFKKTAPGDKNHQGPGRALGAAEPGYPLSGCVPAEPDSVSPGSSSVAADKPYASTIGHRSYALKIPGRSPPHS
jgi:hypothetical protein